MSLGLCAALCVYASSVRAQNGVPLPLPESPPAAIVPAPFDGKAQLDSQAKRAYSVRLRFMKPSTMAFWLDPKNHPASIELQNRAIIGKPNLKESDVVEVPSPQVPTYSLPAGVERIVPADTQNALLIFGRPEGVAQLRDNIAFLDRRAR